MKKIAIGLSLAALTIAGSAFAAQSQHGADRVVARADALARSAQAFERRDTNKDGKLDAADREARRTAMFDRIDANKDGSISRTEFAEMRHGMGQGAKGGAEGHGMGHGRMGGGRMGGGRMGRGMGQRMADANRDGAVTRDEFAAAAASRFDRADSNRDGQLTQAERQAARAAMRERMQGMMHQPGTANPAQPAPAN